MIYKLSVIVFVGCFLIGLFSHFVEDLLRNKSNLSISLTNTNKITPNEWKNCGGRVMYTDSKCLNLCRVSANRTVIKPKADDIISTHLGCHFCEHYPFAGDPVWTYIESYHSHSLDETNTSWGTILDAGTGVTSARWINSLNSKQWVAVTASPQMRNQVLSKMKNKMRIVDHVLLGTWSSEQLKSQVLNITNGNKFDVVIADYLVGAMEGFTPYEQDLIFDQLKPFVGSKLYIIGQEPYYLPNDHKHIGKSQHKNGEELAREIAMNIFKLRDATLHLTGERFYREFPLEWITRILEKSAYTVEDVQAFPIVWGKKALSKQLDLIDTKIKNALNNNIMITASPSITLLKELQQQVVHLRNLVHENTIINGVGVCFGMDYVVAASVK